MQNRNQTDQRSSDINEGLHNVGPDYRRETSFKRVDQSQQGDDRDGGDLACAQCDRHDDRYGIYANALGGRARQQKQARRHRSQLGPEAPLDELICGIKLAAKILRQEYETNNDASDDVPHYHLQEREIRIVGEARNADDGQSAGLGGHDRQRNRPPRNIAIGEEVIPHRPLPLAKAQPEERDSCQVCRDNQQVDPIQSQVILEMRGSWYAVARRIGSLHCTRRFAPPCTGLYCVEPVLELARWPTISESTEAARKRVAFWPPKAACSPKP